MTASGWITSIVPTPVATPRPPWKPRKIERAEPITAATPQAASRAGSPPVTPAGDEDRQGALGEVAERRRSRPACGPSPAGRSCRRSGRSPIVRGSGRAGQPGDDDAERDRPDQVGQADEDDRAERLHRPARTSVAPPGRRPRGTPDRQHSIGPRIALDRLGCAARDAARTIGR